MSKITVYRFCCLEPLSVTPTDTAILTAVGKWCAQLGCGLLFEC